MNGVLGMLDVLGGTSLDGEQDEMVGVARQSALALLAIIDDILDLSKIEAGKLTLEAIPCDLAEVIESAVDLVAGRAAVKGIELAWELSPSLPERVIGDPVRLRQVFLNLMGNAVKFTAYGHVTLKSTLLAWDGANPVIRFEVADTGIGLTDAQQQTLFQPFAQADTATTRQFGGTGLGLSISRRLVEMMGGEIGVFSTFGQGSTFWLEIPFQGIAETTSAAPPLDLTGRTVLVVDDLAVARAGVSQMLRRWGATVLPLSSVAEARAFLGKQGTAPDLMLLDDMPGAMELGREARASVPVLLMAPGEGEAVPGIFGKEEFTLLTKPVRGRTLVRVLAATLQGLPVTLAPSVEPAPVTVTLDEKTAQAAGRLILVAEDNATNRLVIAKQLQRLGHTFHMVEDGVQALEALEKTTYGLLLTDCFMPHLDGYQLARRIRGAEAQTKGGRRLPIVALTANALEGEDGKCREFGMDAYLAKPVVLDRLRDTLAAWLPPPPAPPAVVEPPPPAPVAARATETPVNRTALREILGTDEDEIVAEVLGFFVEAFAELIDRLNTAIAERDRQQLQSAAHAAKGAAANAAAETLAAVLRQIETSAAKGQWGRLARLVAEAEERFGQVREWVEAGLPKAGHASGILLEKAE